jgi:transposase
MVHLRFVNQQIKQIEDTRRKQLEDELQMGSNAKVLELQRISGLGIETADMRLREVFSRDLRDRRAVGHYAGLTGSPNESGSRRQEMGLAKAGNARVRRGNPFQNQARPRHPRRSGTA